MDDSEYFSHSKSVGVHAGQAIEVTYTNDPAEVQRVLDMYKQWIDSGDDKFMGLDMEYTAHKPETKKKTAVLQLAMRRHVLVFHYSCSDTWQSPALADFLRFSKVTFASVDNTTDKKVLLRTWNIELPTEFYVDIQDVYEKVFKKKKVGMAPMAAELIDPWYEDMKKKLHWRAHDMWEKNPLDWVNLKYAAIDGFVSLELYRVLKPMAAAIKPSISSVSGAGTSSSSESSDGSSRAN